MVLDQDGGNLGAMNIRQALDLAQERELDLVEINPKGIPPVVKLIDFTEFKYQKEKEVRKQKAHSHVSETKGIRLSVRIGEHDLHIRKDQATKFLERGDKVRAEVILKGRENAHPELAREVIQRFMRLVSESIETRMEQDISKQGTKMSAIIARK